MDITNYTFSHYQKQNYFCCNVALFGLEPIYKLAWIDPDSPFLYTLCNHLSLVKTITNFTPIKCSYCMGLNNYMWPFLFMGLSMLHQQEVLGRVGVLICSRDRSSLMRLCQAHSWCLLMRPLYLACLRAGTGDKSAAASQVNILLWRLAVDMGGWDIGEGSSVPCSSRPRSDMVKKYPMPSYLHF